MKAVAFVPPTVAAPLRRSLRIRINDWLSMWKAIMLAELLSRSNGNVE